MLAPPEAAADVSGPKDEPGNTTTEFADDREKDDNSSVPFALQQLRACIVRASVRVCMSGFCGNAEMYAFVGPCPVRVRSTT